MVKPRGRKALVIIHFDKLKKEVIESLRLVQNNFDGQNEPTARMRKVNDLLRNRVLYEG